MRAWQAAYRGLLPDDLLDGLSAAAWGERRRRALAAPYGPHVRNHVLEGAGGLIGWASTGAARDPDLDAARVGELYALYLEPAAVGQGHGRRLLAHAHAGLAEQGFVEVVLWVLEGNARARRFYERAGLRLDPRVPPRPVTLQGRALDVREVRYACEVHVR